MSIFKKMREKLEKVWEEYSAREVDLLNELCERLREIGVNGTVHVSESWKEPFGRMPISHILGYVKVEGRNIDLIQLEMKQHTGTEGEVEYFEYFYYYVVQANVKGLEGKLKAEVEPIKKGFLSREIVDFRWEGGELAQRLNGDADLRNMLLKEGLNQLPSIEVKPQEKPRQVPMIGKPPQAFLEVQASFKPCVRITKQPKIREYMKVWFGSIQTVGRKEFPTREDFEIYDRIAQHIRSMVTDV